MCCACGWWTSSGEGVKVKMVLFAAAAAATVVVVFRVLGVFCLPDNLRGAPLL